MTLEILKVFPGYCDPDVYGVVVVFRFEKIEYSSYVEFKKDLPYGKIDCFTYAQKDIHAKVDFYTQDDIQVKDERELTYLTAMCGDEVLEAARPLYNEALIYRDGNKVN